MAALAVTLCGNAVYAQDAAPGEITQQLLACDEITDLTKRLVCFNELVDGLKRDLAAPEASPAAGPAAAAVAAVDPEPEPIVESPDEAADATVAESPPAAPVPESRPAATPAATAAVASAAAIPAEPPVEVQSAPAAPAAESSNIPSAAVDDFGRDSIRTKAEEEEEQVVEEDKPFSINATIVRSWRNHDGRFSVELDNGQVWRETQGTRVGFPKEGKTIELFEGRFGGYRMRIEDIRKIAWVRRTK